MEGKTRIPTVVLIVVAVVAAAAGGWWLLSQRANPAGSGTVAGAPSTNPKSGQPAVVVPPPVEPTKIKFERTVRLGEAMNLEVRFRDYATLPKDFASLDDVRDQLKALPGKATITVKSFAATEPVGGMVAESGITYYAAQFDLTGDAKNPTGGRIVPGSIEAVGEDLFPQIILLQGDDILYLSSPDSKQYNRATGLPSYRQIAVTQDRPVALGAVFKWPNANKPILALEYVDMSGIHKYIRINY